MDEVGESDSQDSQDGEENAEESSDETGEADADADGVSAEMDGMPSSEMDDADGEDAALKCQGSAVGCKALSSNRRPVLPKGRQVVITSPVPL